MARESGELRFAYNQVLEPDYLPVVLEADSAFSGKSFRAVLNLLVEPSGFFPASFQSSTFTWKASLPLRRQVIADLAHQLKAVPLDGFGEV